MSSVSSALIEHTRGRDFTDRLQHVLNTAGLWRLAIVEAMAATTDEWELDRLMDEMEACAAIMRDLAGRAEKLKVDREGH